MCGMIMMGILFFLAIVGGFSAVSFIFGSAFESGGWIGIIGLILLFIVLCVVISNDGGKGKK